MRCVLEARNLHVWLSGRHVLKGIDLCVQPNTITAIIGPSGSGKTTLLRTFNRLLELDEGARVEGDVLFMGRSVFDYEPHELRRRVVMMLQEPTPFPHMTIFDNVALPIRVHGLARDGARLEDLVRRALEMAALWDEVKDRLRDYPSSLSGGQRQRLCLARALAAQPEVLLLDEPTASVDPATKAKIEEAMARLRSSMTIVLVTHDRRQAERLGDQVVELREGRAFPVKLVFALTR